MNLEFIPFNNGGGNRMTGLRELFQSRTTVEYIHQPLPRILTSFLVLNDCTISKNYSISGVELVNPMGLSAGAYTDQKQCYFFLFSKELLKEHNN